MLLTVQSACPGPSHAIVEAERQALRPLPSTTDLSCFTGSLRRHFAEQQVDAAGGHHQRQQLIEPACRHELRQQCAHGRTDGRTDQRTPPYDWFEQASPVEGVAGSRRAEGGGQLVRAQHEMGR